MPVQTLVLVALVTYLAVEFLMWEQFAGEC